MTGHNEYGAPSPSAGVDLRGMRWRDDAGDQLGEHARLGSPEVLQHPELLCLILERLRIAQSMSSDIMEVQLDDSP